jgi:hypothetical protein
MQLLLWAKVKMGRKGFGREETGACESEEEEVTNIVVMNPDISAAPCYQISLKFARERAVDICIPMVSWVITKGMECTNLSRVISGPDTRK